VSHLFVRLYLDEDVSVLIKQLLASRGYDVITTLEASRTGASDAEQLSFAAEQGRAIVTHNHGDYEALASDYLACARDHSGIIIAHRRRPNAVAGRLLFILDRVAADEMRNQVLYI
jgi:hypothetical protein